MMGAHWIKVNTDVKLNFKDKNDGGIRAQAGDGKNQLGVQNTLQK